MRRRLDIAASIVVTPQLMFLDEPITGLDPRSRNQVWDIIRELIAQGTTVLLTTQYLEADQLADRIVVIDHGNVIAEGTPDSSRRPSARARSTCDCWIPRSARAEQVLTSILDAPVHLDSDPAALSARISDAERTARSLGELSRAGIAVADFSLGQPTLDEVFLALTGPPAEDPASDGETRAFGEKEGVA